MPHAQNGEWLGQAIGNDHWQQFTSLVKRRPWQLGAQLFSTSYVTYMFLVAVHTHCCSQPEGSPLSVLQKGRNNNVLPNGGGRLWAMKDTTGAGIWCVVPSTRDASESTASKQQC